MNGTSALLITHTDRDGIFSGAALLRALGGMDRPNVLLTQGSFLAEELEELADAGQRYDRLYICDTYWYAPHAERLAVALRRLLSPGGTVAWLDHHPETVEHEKWIRATIGLDPLSRILGDRAGKHEAVSLVAVAFGVVQDPVVSDLLKATAGGWERKGEPVPEGVRRWLRIVDSLPRFPDLPPRTAAEIVRHLARGFDVTPPAGLATLETMAVEVERRTAELADEVKWPRLPSVDGGYGMCLDLSDERLANGYVVARTLFDAADRNVDYFVVSEHPALVHFVSGERARKERDRLERSRPPGLRVSTMHKGTRKRADASRRSRSGIDLHHLTKRQPARDVVDHWIDAHPYLVKGMWREGVYVNPYRIRATADEIGRVMQDVLLRYGWTDVDRRVPWRRAKRVTI